MEEDKKQKDELEQALALLPDLITAARLVAVAKNELAAAERKHLQVWKKFVKFVPEVIISGKQPPRSSVAASAPILIRT